jgi:hypothetical protein
LNSIQLHVFIIENISMIFTAKQLRNQPLTPIFLHSKFMKKKKLPLRIHGDLIHEIKVRLESFGEDHLNDLAKRTELSRTTISKYFNEKIVGFPAERKIFDTSLLLLEEYGSKAQERVRLLKILGLNHKSNRGNLN